MSALAGFGETEGAVPCAADAVERWFEPLLARRLAQAGMGTLGALAQRINEAGARWWYPVRGMGVTRAARVVQWLQAQPGALGLRAPAVNAVLGESGVGRGDKAAPRVAGSQALDWAGQLGALQPVEH
ncbi:phage integrase family protein [Xenophilus sp. Marseille-Q4582]|uniref:phage integrase family protein n=1 Tax=Xenophilus sp. Marseille-Q4582 TaxID=2866600 RepID=UPI001CE42670|nr:phage integrase family protein [Xenophilus sp. Marseille-Q4582]